MASKIKHHWDLSRTGAAALLRGLADALERGGGEVPGYDIRLDGLDKFKLKIEPGAGDVLTVAFSGKGVALADAETDEAAYASLKKRLQAAFTVLYACLRRDELPPQETVAAFLTEAGGMVGFSGFGDEGYSAFTTLCERVQTAFAAGDVAALRLVTEELVQARKQCHARFK